MITSDKNPASMFKGFKKWSDSSITPTAYFKSETKMMTTLKRTKIGIFMSNQLLKGSWANKWPKTVTTDRFQSPVRSPIVILFFLYQNEVFFSNKICKMQLLTKMRLTYSNKRAFKKIFPTLRTAKSFWILWMKEAIRPMSSKTFWVNPHFRNWKFLRWAQLNKAKSTLSIRKRLCWKENSKRKNPKNLEERLNDYRITFKNF